MKVDGSRVELVLQVVASPAGFVLVGFTDRTGPVFDVWLSAGNARAFARMLERAATTARARAS